MENNQNIVTQTPSDSLSLYKNEWTVEDVLDQIKRIQSLMSQAMKEGEHYGIIPGTKKHSLYKSGAEKLGLLFRLVPEFEITEKELPNFHREYIVKCTLRHILTDKIIGSGIGSCSTMEGKYRYRTKEAKITGKPVPKQYWDVKKESSAKAQELIGGDGYSVKKINNKWEIVKIEIGEKSEHDNPADHYNTVLKMAKKRSHVDATITATAASDIFTQDMDELAETKIIEGQEIQEIQEINTIQQHKSNHIEDTKVVAAITSVSPYDNLLKSLESIKNDKQVVDIWWEENFEEINKCALQQKTSLNKIWQEAKKYSTEVLQ